MSTINIKFDEARARQLKVSQMRAIENLQLGERARLNVLVPIIAQFVTNGDGNFLEASKAEALLDDLTGEQLGELVKSFEEKMRVGAVPLASAPPVPASPTG